MKIKWTLLYVAAIAAINWAFANIPVWIMPWGDAWPPTTLAVGAVFVLRDFAQREIGHKVLLAMICGAILSYFMATPTIALASATAYAVSELADWAVYSFTRRPLRQRILLSSCVGTPLDSWVFLGMIGFASWSAILLMTATKMLAALVVWRGMKGRMK